MEKSDIKNLINLYPENFLNFLNLNRNKSKQKKLLSKIAKEDFLSDF
jgi:hypothetical protein